MKNAYAKQLQEKKQLREYFVKKWTAQMCMDVMTIVLNDPDIMGKDTFGRERLKRIGEAFNKQFAECLIALLPHPENEYMRVKIDEAIKRIMGPDALKWNERYEGFPKRSGV